MTRNVPPAWKPYSRNEREFPQHNVRLPPWTHNELTALAEELGVSVALLIRVVLSKVVAGEAVSRVVLKVDSRRRG